MQEIVEKTLHFKGSGSNLSQAEKEAISQFYQLVGDSELLGTGQDSPLTMKRLHEMETVIQKSEDKVDIELSISVTGPSHILNQWQHAA